MTICGFFPLDSRMAQHCKPHLVFLMRGLIHCCVVKILTSWGAQALVGDGAAFIRDGLIDDIHVKLGQADG